MRSRPDVERFYKIFAERAATALRLIFLTVDRTRIAFVLRLFAVRKSSIFSKLVMTPGYARYSPYACSVISFCEMALKHGLDEYEFLGSNEEWKRDWTQERGRTTGCLCFRKVCARAFFTMPSSDWFRSSSAAAVCALPGGPLRPESTRRPFILGWQTGGIGPRRRAGVSSGKPAAA